MGPRLPSGRRCRSPIPRPMTMCPSQISAATWTTPGTTPRAASAIRASGGSGWWARLWSRMTRAAMWPGDRGWPMPSSRGRSGAIPKATRARIPMPSPWACMLPATARANPGTIHRWRMPSRRVRWPSPADRDSAIGATVGFWLETLPCGSPTRAAWSGSKTTTAVSAGRRVARASTSPQPGNSANRCHRRSRSGPVAARARTCRGPSDSSTVVSGFAWRFSHQAGSLAPQPFMARLTRFSPSWK
jgi:hypothetical protein